MAIGVVLGTLTFLPTKWCTGNHKPVIPVNPSKFKKELQSFLEGKELKKKNACSKFANISRFPEEEVFKVIGKIHNMEWEVVTTRSMNSSEPIATTMILPESTEEKLGTPKKQLLWYC